MANTKQLSREDRKKAKIKARRAIKSLVSQLSKGQRKKWNKSGQGIKVFLAENEADK